MATENAIEEEQPLVPHEATTERLTFADHVTPDEIHVSPPNSSIFNGLHDKVRATVSRSDILGEVLLEHSKVHLCINKFHCILYSSTKFHKFYSNFDNV